MSRYPKKKTESNSSLIEAVGIYKPKDKGHPFVGSVKVYAEKGDQLFVIHLLSGRSFAIKHEEFTQYD